MLSPSQGPSRCGAGVMAQAGRLPMKLALSGSLFICFCESMGCSQLTLPPLPLKNPGFFTPLDSDPKMRRKSFPPFQPERHLLHSHSLSPTPAPPPSWEIGGWVILLHRKTYSHPQGEVWLHSPNKPVPLEGDVSSFLESGH